MKSKFYTLYENMNKELTPEAWYEFRTNDHINRVRKFIDKLPNMPDDEKKKRKRAHDQSKFEDPERDPYVWISWKYKCKDDGLDFDSYNPPQGIDDKMSDATHHHVTTNSHHPEFWSPVKTGLLNRENRDKPPEQMVDATKMPKYDIMEMCADWAAMSDEKGGTPQKWANDNVNVRWKFDPDQVELIKTTLDSIWAD